MATGNPLVYLDFSGGVHQSDGTYLLKDNQCADARNYVASEHGALVKRRGFSRISSINSSVPAQLLNSAHSLFPVNLSTKLLLAAGPVFSAAGTDSIVSITPAGVATSRRTGMTANRRWEFVQGPVGNQSAASFPNGMGAPANQGPIFGMNGANTPQRWDGVAASMSDWTAWNGTVPSGTPYLIYHLDKFWATGDPNFPGRVWSTGLQSGTIFNTLLPDPCNWDTDNIDDVEPADGQANTAIGTVGPYVLMFKDRKTYVVSDPVGRAYRPISTSIGCCSHRSVVETARGTLFLSEDMGVCLTDGSKIEPVSEAIMPLLKEIAEASPTSLRNAAATYFQESYYLSVPFNDTKNTLLLEYQVDQGAWWIHSIAAADFALLDPSGNPALYSAFPGTNRIDRCFVPNSYADDGLPYDSYWEGPYWSWGNPHLNKRVSQFRMDGEGAWTAEAAERFREQYEVMDSNDLESPLSTGELFGGAGTFEGSGTFGPRLGIIQRNYPTPLDGWGRAWSIRISDSNSMNRMAIYSIAAFLRGRTD